MLSRISKISVFGIVALMLAFGLTATDAFAQAAGTNTIVVTADPDPLRAAAPATITFTLTVVDRVDAVDPTPATPASTVTINIPYEWSARPIESNECD